MFPTTLRRVITQKSYVSFSMAKALVHNKQPSSSLGAQAQRKIYVWILYCT